MEVKAEVVFVNELEVSGFVNGVVNMAFSTLQFVPASELVRSEEDPNMMEEKLVISPAPVITANLRFDLRLAQIIHARLGQFIEEHTKPAPRMSN